MAYRTEEKIKALDNQFIGPFLASFVKVKSCEGFITIAHRGGKCKYPENSLEAFRESIKLGCDGVECDVIFSRDMIPVAAHHSLVEVRKDDGFAKFNMKEMHWDEIKQLRLSSGVQIQSLEEILLFVRDKVKRVYLHDKVENVQKSICDEEKRIFAFSRVIRDVGMQNLVVVMVETGDLSVWRHVAGDVQVLPCWSFAEHQDYHVTLAVTERLGLKHSGIYDQPGQLRPLGRYFARAGFVSLGYISGFWPKKSDIEPYVNQGCDFVVFTVNDVLRMKLYMKAGFRAIGTDYPERLLRLKQELGS